MQLRKLILTALFTALTFVATFFIKIPTPTMGYIHPGDAFVLLAGIFLGPLYGGFAAGFGSMLSDLAGGYLLYAPATFIIKAAVAALVQPALFRLKKLSGRQNHLLPVVSGSILSEILMVLGYFVYEIFLLAFTASSSLTNASLSSGIAAAASGIPFNIIQAAFGVVLVAVLYPILLPLWKKNQATVS